MWLLTLFGCGIEVLPRQEPVLHPAPHEVPAVFPRQARGVAIGDHGRRWVEPDPVPVDAQGGRWALTAVHLHPDGDLAVVESVSHNTLWDLESGESWRLQPGLPVFQDRSLVVTGATRVVLALDPTPTVVERGLGQSPEAGIWWTAGVLRVGDVALDPADGAVLGWRDPAEVLRSGRRTSGVLRWTGVAGAGTERWLPLPDPRLEGTPSPTGERWFDPRRARLIEEDGDDVLTTPIRLGKEAVSDAAWSLDGQLGVATSRRVVLVGPRGERHKTLRRPARQIALDAHAEALALISPNGALQLHDFGGAERCRVAAPAGMPAMAFGPDDPGLALVWRGGAAVLEPDCTARWIRYVPEPIRGRELVPAPASVLDLAPSHARVAWLPDNSRMVFATHAHLTVLDPSRPPTEEEWAEASGVWPDGPSVQEARHRWRRLPHGRHQEGMGHVAEDGA